MASPAVSPSFYDTKRLDDVKRAKQFHARNETIGQNWTPKRETRLDVSSEATKRLGETIGHPWGENS